MYTLRGDSSLISQSCQSDSSGTQMGHTELQIPDESDVFETQAQADDQCSPSLAAQDISSVEGSYVSLLADIATIEKNEEIQNSQSGNSVQTSSGQMIYTCTSNEFTDDAAINTDDFIQYQHLPCTLTNAEDSTAEQSKHFIIVQPMHSLYPGQEMSDSQTVMQVGRDQAVSQIALEQSREFEEAVANIQDVDVNRIGDSSFSVSTNDDGFVEGIKIIQKSSVSTGQKGSTSKLSGKSKVSKKERDVLKEYQFSNSLKKFTAEELSSHKTKSEIICEYLKKAKQVSCKNPDSKDKHLKCVVSDSLNTAVCSTSAASRHETSSDDVLHKNEKLGSFDRGAQLNSCEMLQILDDKQINDTQQSGQKDLFAQFKEPHPNERTVSMELGTTVSNTSVLALHAFKESSSVADCTRDTFQSKLDIPISKETFNHTPAVVTRTSKRIAAKHPVSETDTSVNTNTDTKPAIVRQHGRHKRKLVKKIKTNADDGDNVEADNLEERYADLCSIEEYMDKVLLRISPITLKTVSKKHLEIEVDIFDCLNMSEIKKDDVSVGHSRLKFQISKPSSDASTQAVVSDTDVKRTKKKLKYSKSKTVSKMNLCKSEGTGHSLGVDNEHLFSNDEDDQNYDRTESIKVQTDTVIDPDLAVRDTAENGQVVKLEKVFLQKHSNGSGDSPDKDSDPCISTQNEYSALADTDNERTKSINSDGAEQKDEAEHPKDEIEDNESKKEDGTGVTEKKKKKSYVVRYDQEGERFLIFIKLKKLTHRFKTFSVI